MPGRVADAPAYLRSFSGLPSSAVISDRGYVVMLVGGPSASTLDTTRVRAMRYPCLKPALAGDLPPGSDAESIALGGQTLVMVVLGEQKTNLECQIEWNLQPLTIWRAASQRTAGQAPTRVPLAARLRVDGVPVEPLRAYTRPAFKQTATGWERDGNQLRYYYDQTIVAPRADGQPRVLSVDVWDREAMPAKLDFEPMAAERLALESIAWRLAVRADSSPRRPLALRSSRTIAPALAHMLDSSASDATQAAISAASWATSARDTLTTSGVVARLVVAEALIGQREPALAQSVVAGVMREHPCLVPPAGASASLSEMAQSHRDRVRCETVPPTKALALGVVPGMGSLALHDRGRAAFGAGLVVVPLLRALMLDHQAKQRYAEYLAARQPGEASSIYRGVSDLRDERTITLGVAGALWVIDAVRAAHDVAVHNRKVADDRF